jgi:hypothetical protein
VLQWETGKKGGEILIRLLGVVARMIGLAGCIAILPYALESVPDDQSSFAPGYQGAPAIGIGPERNGQHWHR